MSQRTLVLAVVLAARPLLAAEGSGLTAVAGIKVGHYTLKERPTGCTVVLVEGGATGGGRRPRRRAGHP